MQPGEWARFRMLNAVFKDNIYFGIPQDMRDDCQAAILAYDGVYLDKPRKQDDIFIPSGMHWETWVGWGVGGGGGGTTSRMRLPLRG